MKILIWSMIGIGVLTVGGIALLGGFLLSLAWVLTHPTF